MAALDPAVAAVRHAVRPHLTTDVLVACSGGPDSMALAAAAAWLGPRAGHRVGLVTVDHQLQPGSSARADAVAAWGKEAGFAPVVVSTVDVSGRTGGPEAAARDARYEALAAAATTNGIDTVLLGHTREDQAETVLLALVRGGGTRGLAGMPQVRVRDGVSFVRPLLDVSRTQARAAGTALRLPVWDDPHNTDPAFRRTHARALLASLVDSLGPSVVENLARTARLAAADNAVLDALAAAALTAPRTGEPAPLGTDEPALGTDEPAPLGTDELALGTDELAALPAAIRTRVLHAWARRLGVPGSALAHTHVSALDALVTDWHGQGAVWLPGGIAVRRSHGTLVQMDHLPPTDG